MIADPLTKAMRPERMSTTLRGGTFDQAATPESVIANMAKQMQRSRGADDGTSFPFNVAARVGSTHKSHECEYDYSC